MEALLNDWRYVGSTGHLQELKIARLSHCLVPEFQVPLLSPLDVITGRKRLLVTEC